MRGTFEERKSSVLNYMQLEQRCHYEIIEAADTTQIGTIVRGCEKDKYGIYAIVLYRPNYPDSNWAFITDNTPYVTRLRFRKIKSGKLTLEW